MANVLWKHARNNWFDKTFVNFEDQLSKGMISVAAIPGGNLIRSYCETCGQPVSVIKYHGERLEIQAQGVVWIMHQCPPEVLDEIANRRNAAQHGQEDMFDADEPQRDGDGEIV